MTKRILSLLLALLLVVSVLPVSTYAEDATDDLGYKDRKVKFVYDLNVSNDPESELDWSAAKQIPLSEIPADFVAVIAATKVLESRDELWFQIKAQTDQELPAVFGENTWVFQDKVTTPVGATMILDCEICGDFECTAVHVKCPDCGEYDCGGHTEPEKPGLTDPETSVQVAADNLPADVELRVKPADVSQQLAQFYIPAENLVFALDISLTQNGQTYQTPATVKVPVDATPGTKIGILHTHGDETSYLGMVEVAADNTVEFQTDGFSEFAGFTVTWDVDLNDPAYDYSHFFEGGKGEKLSAILKRYSDAKNLGVTITPAMVKDVTCTGGVTVTKEADGDWTLLANEMFSRTETLTITFNAAETQLIIYLTAKEANIVTFHPEGGKVKGQDSYTLVVTRNASFNSEISWIDVVKDHYVFAGWYDAQGEKVYYGNAEEDANHKFGYSVPNTQYWLNNEWVYENDLDLYAKWVPKEYTATIIVKDNTYTQNYTIETSLDLSGYKDGAGVDPYMWKISSYSETDSNWRDYPRHATYKNSILVNSAEDKTEIGYWGDVTLTAQWYHKLIFDYAGGYNEKNTASTRYENGYAITGEGACCTVEWLYPVRPGYTFIGWYDQPQNYTGSDIVKVYLGDDGDISKTGQCNPGTKYWSSGWQWIGESDLTMYAHWNPDSYTVTFDANGGSVAQATATVTYDAAYGTLPTPSREGHSFLGWFTAKEGGVQVTEQTVYKTAGNSTLYAQWERTNADLTIQVSNASADQNYIFIVSNADQSIQRSIVVKGSSSVTIADLPVGKYTVTPLSGWVWRQNVTVADNSADLTKGDQKITFGCSIIDGLKYWLNGYGYGKGT